MGYLGSPLGNGGKITLDKETFKVLASETRIGILKKLDEKQMTVSDLARGLGMNKSTLFEHLEKLINAGLIKKKEDQRKWVYYTLTWKGKNILHPERTKIAIALSISVLCSILLVYLIISIVGSGIFNPPPRTGDYTAPTIDFSLVDDITEKTVMPVEMIIDVHDNKGINESSLKVEYTISDFYAQEPESLSGWQEIASSLEQGRASVFIPSINWSDNSGKYLYVRCSVSDKSGNSAQNVFVEYIEKVYEDSIDLSVSISDVSFEKNVNSIPSEGYQEIPIKIKIHNIGSFDVYNTELSIFGNNPDTDNDGIVDNYTSLIKTQNIDFIESENVTSVELTIELNLSRAKYFWVAIDPSNVFNETDEYNNLVNVSLRSFLKTSIIPEFPIHIVAFASIFVILLHSIYRKRREQK